MTFVFWFSMFLVCYAYFGYPLCLYLICIVKPNSVCRVKRSSCLNVAMNPTKPSVTLLISAYNEEDAIEEKILNSLKSDYPKELLEIIIVSDGSGDRTNEIVTKYVDHGVKLYDYEGRIGKTACINKTIPLAKGDIIIFSDANSLYDNDAIKHLVKHFEDKNIGFVTGHTMYVLEGKERHLSTVGIYAKIEKLTKQLESKIGSCVGADGAIFAIRKRLYMPLKAHDINDFVIPINIVQEGFRGVFEDGAFCFEKTARNQTGEFNRQVRITNRTLRAIFSHSELLNPFKYHIFSFELISHKLLKFLTPFLLLFILLVNMLLVLGHQGNIYLLTLLIQILCYFMAWLGQKQTKVVLLSKLGSYFSTFAMVNIAIMAGWLKYIKGETYTTWNPNR